MAGGCADICCFLSATCRAQWDGQSMVVPLKHCCQLLMSGPLFPLYCLPQITLQGSKLLTRCEKTDCFGVVSAAGMMQGPLGRPTGGCQGDRARHINSACCDQRGAAAARPQPPKHCKCTCADHMVSVQSARALLYKSLDIAWRVQHVKAALR